MDNVPIIGLDELDKHLDDLIADPNLSLVHKLFDDVEIQLTDSNIPALLPSFLPKLTTLLKQYHGNPEAIVSLTIKFLGPVSFTQVLQLASEESLIQALSAPAPDANILVMTIIGKAAATPNDAAILSVMPDLFRAFIQRWLTAPQVEVGQKGGKVLGDLLDIDCPLPPPPPARADAPIPTHTELVLRRAPGKGLLWELLFNNESMYRLLLDILSGRDEALAEGDTHQLSLAHGRILRILPRLATLNLEAISTSQFTATTPSYNINGHSAGFEDGSMSAPRPGDGLLQFAALYMVDKKDVLMHFNLVDFFETFVSLMRVAEHSARRVEITKALLRDAVASDDTLKNALLTLPERIVEEERGLLRAWLTEIMPEELRLVIR
ncbi:hypothetical protein QBC35DRAFT_113522 [Podospora australis]|uniref:DNA mismatch repair protein HSM3 N-terminal domain-containing protein n=1 Tax=Podospora australis TaxID=1536484 RepID=A0AAN6WKC0_9PEZI|nr:hypothetical protein QBC35DRAFT_113522 [Podospora australis]